MVARRERASLFCARVALDAPCARSRSTSSFRRHVQTPRRLSYRSARPSRSRRPVDPVRTRALKNNMLSLLRPTRESTSSPPTHYRNQEQLDCVATYDVRPSFAPERHWRLRRNGSTYSLESWKSARSVGSQAGEHDTEHRAVPFPSELATLVRDIWLNAILESHYPAFTSVAQMVTTITSVATRDDSLLLRAEVWSPDADLPPALASRRRRPDIQPRSRGFQRRRGA